MSKTKFDCSCRGCRDYPTNPGSVWPEAKISQTEAEGSYYFSPATMQAFKSRILLVRTLAAPVENSTGAAVVVSSAHPSLGRVYEVVRMCRFGRVTREHTPDGIEHFATSASARKDALKAEYPSECDCHGCVLDREGR